MKLMIEPVAGRLFDIYYQYINNSDLVALQSLTEEAYKLHERLRKLPSKNVGLLGLDEFGLLKALRNHSVHRDDFIGKAYMLKRQFAQRHKLDLLRVCLVHKKTVNTAINRERPLDIGEQEKVAKIKGQLVDFGDSYNIEPVIFNFMVKVYEKLIAMKIAVPGRGFKEIDSSYKKEVYHNFPHYVPLQSLNISNEEVLSNIQPLERITTKLTECLPDEADDPFHKVAELDIEPSVLKVAEYEGEDYQFMHDGIFKKITSDADTLKLAQYFPKHIGLALVSATDSSQPSEVTGFNIRKQKAAFDKAGIELDSSFYQTNAFELLVLLIIDGTIFPVIISKAALFEQVTVKKLPRTENLDCDKVGFDFPGEEPFEINVPKTKSQPLRQQTHFGVKTGRNDPCHCGSGKKYKKCCLQ